MLASRGKGVALLALFVGGCAAHDHDTAVGTLVYAERGTQHIRVLDIGAGTSELIDDGQFGSVSIAPDAKHVAYSGVDKIVKVADRAGTITPLLPDGGCSTIGDWISSSTLRYCISDSQHQGTMLVASVDHTSPRYLDAYGVAVSGDGSLDAYVNARGDLIVERIDGSDRRVLVPSPDPSAINPSMNVGGFTPDMRALLISDYVAYPNGIHIVTIADGVSINVDDVWFSGTPLGAPTFRGASMFSPDHSEILMQSSTGLVAVAIASGAKRMIAPFPARISSGGAVFLDAEHVLWVRVEDRSVGDLGAFRESLHIAGPTANDDVVLDDPQTNNSPWPSIVVSPAGFIGIPSDVLLVKMDGTVLVRNDSSPDSAASDILGLTPDGGGVITTSFDGIVHYVDVDGTVRDLATTGRAGDLLGPVAAYTSSVTP